MGIQGLLPLLKDIQVKTYISTYSGQTVGIDAYCWLHKACYGCAKDLALNKPTRVYIGYVMRRLDMLISHNVTPILVFDGGHLPAKADTERQRRTRKTHHRQLALAALKEGNNKEANENFQRCVEITPEIASEVIQECYSMNVQCIVAPYEADAQLAYLMKEGITQLTISEDSDLLLYGCNKVMYKMSPDGEGLVIDLADLPNVRTIQLSSFTVEKFRHMCMLSGCDYLPSVKGMGLMKAFKAMRRFSSVFQCIKALKCDRAFSVPKGYEENFRKADLVFKYQLVFDIRTKSLTRLNEICDIDNFGDAEKKFAGPKLDDSKGLQIALGNINPTTDRILANRKDFASGDISQNAKRSSSWEDNAPNSNTAFQFHGSSQQSSANIALTDVQKLVKLKESPSAIVCPQQETSSSDLAANKSLKRLLEVEVSTPTREEKIRKLYGDDDVDTNIPNEIEKVKSPPKCRDNSARHHNLFSKRAHKFNNPFRQTVHKPQTEKVVSRFFDTRVSKSKENIVLQVDTPPGNETGLRRESTKLLKMDGSFLEYLDKTNLRGYEVKKLTLSPEKSEGKQNEKLSLKKSKKYNICSLFKKESVEASNLDESAKKENNSLMTSSKEDSIDFNVTVPLDGGSFKGIKKEGKSNIFSHFQYKVNSLPEAVKIDCNLEEKTEEIVGDGCGLQSVHEEKDMEIVEFKSASAHNAVAENLSDASNKRKNIKLGLSKNSSKGCRSWSNMLNNSKSKNNELECDPLRKTFQKALPDLNEVRNLGCDSMDVPKLEMNTQLETNNHVLATETQIIICDDEIIEKDGSHVQEDLLFSHNKDVDVKAGELTEEPLPQHLIRKKRNVDLSYDDNNNKHKPVDVVYLDDEEPLPFHINDNKLSGYFEKKSIPCKIPAMSCKPIGLRKKRKSLEKHVFDDKLKQMTFERFSFKKKPVIRSEDVECLS